MAEITVIIPLYNGEAYLARCIDSVLNQTFTELQILIINDGSTDSSLKIARAYASKHEHIKVLTHKNIGVAKTRNRGIEHVTSPYTMFVDQDDWLDSDYCERFYNEITDTNWDVVSGGYRRPDAIGINKKTGLPANTPYGKYVLMAAWAKIHRTQFLQENNITFFDNKFGEDSVFTVKEIALAKGWKHIDYVGYNWFYNDNSVSNTVQKQLSDTHNNALLRLLEELVSVTTNGRDPLFQYFLLRTAIFYLLFSGRTAGVRDFMVTYRLLFNWLQPSTSSLSLRNTLMGPRGEEARARISIAVFMMLHRLKLVGIFARGYCRG